MDYKIFLLFLTLYVQYIFCRTVKFKVISFGKKTYVQIVGGDKYQLSPVSSDDILHSVEVSNVSSSEFKYYYIVDDVKEDFQRTFKSDTNKTYNEFYGRKDTIKTLKTFKHPSDLKTWDRSIGRTSLFDESYIPTVHITGDTAENFFHEPKKYNGSKLESVKFYLKDSVESFTKVYTTNKNRDFSKFQIKFELNNSSGEKRDINGRYILKLRNGGEDPLNLRQYIYGNIIQAIGMPSLHSVMVRVYYNKKPAGFYTLQETVPTDSFIKTEFYGNPSTGKVNAPKPLGTVLDGTTGSDFEYKPNDGDYYGVYEGASKDKLIAFCKALSELDPSSESKLSEFEKKWFDIDTFHKAMAMEYLTGDWDGYWYTTSNFAVYDDPNESSNGAYKFYFITQDHDETFGVGLEGNINTVGYKFPQQSYTTMINRTWNIAEDDAKYRTLVDKFIGSTPKLQKRFEKTLLSIVSNIFNPVAFREVVNSYYERFEPEVKWDYSFTRPFVKKNQNPNFGYSDFLKNFEEGLPGLNWGIYEWKTTTTTKKTTTKTTKKITTTTRKTTTKTTKKTTTKTTKKTTTTTSKSTATNNLSTDGACGTKNGKTKGREYTSIKSLFI
ncbi:hypothetical protein BCR32DRAFT_266873 [Anaeromyces robustus]|uniref:Coth-domain-containing protein n=1 Tax=Anaeromyces robustus TaxID=1754192 RepID=A0A1Y1XDQ1_9FUNG|nr:hypothetical protein BCR32DRAFT_266873 [Anaeromyces robustus]|eukprot:ORX83576.1 hypothetical protein BCR32DRAFT_266873 [Anaeromyces robustus]